MSSKFSANSSKLHAITDTPKIVAGKISGALEMDASRIESVNIENSPRLNTSEFSVSFWLKKGISALPYSYVVSLLTILQGRAGILTWVIREQWHTNFRSFQCCK